MVADLTSDVVSAMRLQLTQMKRWAIVTGLTSTSVERDHLISMWQLGQIGGSNCSSDCLSLSTI
jgi:hypothetical protein